MSTSYTSWAEWAFDQMLAYQRSAFFVLGCLQREQIANLHALGVPWMRPPIDWPGLRAPADTVNLPESPRSRSVAPPRSR